MMPHYPAAGFDSLLGFESKRLEFLTGFTIDSILIINPQRKFAITNWVDSKLLKVKLSHLLTHKKMLPGGVVNERQS